jgi:hypothetical protein
MSHALLIGERTERFEMQVAGRAELPPLRPIFVRPAARLDPATSWTDTIAPHVQRARSALSLLVTKARSAVGNSQEIALFIRGLGQVLHQILWGPRDRLRKPLTWVICGAFIVVASSLLRAAWSALHGGFH